MLLTNFVTMLRHKMTTYAIGHMFLWRLIALCNLVWVLWNILVFHNKIQRKYLWLGKEDPCGAKDQCACHTHPFLLKVQRKRCNIGYWYSIIFILTHPYSSHSSYSSYYSYNRLLWLLLLVPDYSLSNDLHAQTLCTGYLLMYGDPTIHLQVNKHQ